MANIGYVRVSTEEQNTARQDHYMELLGVDKVFIDKASGKNKERPEFQKMLNYVREGDTVIVESLSRLGRSTKDLLETMDILREKNVDLKSLKEQWDTSTASGKLIFTVMAAISEFERTVMLERQAEGIAEAKKRGVYKGRKPIAVDEELFTELYRQWKNGETQPKYMMKKLGLTRNTFYRKVKAYEVKHGICVEENGDGK